MAGPLIYGTQGTSRYEGSLAIEPPVSPLRGGVSRKPGPTLVWPGFSSAAPKRGCTARAAAYCGHGGNVGAYVIYSFEHWRGLTSQTIPRRHFLGSTLELNVS